MSIYQTISGALNAEGRLPRNFELPRKETPPNEIRWMVGARDGTINIVK